MSILYDDAQNAIFEESRRVLDARASKDRLLALIENTGEWDHRFWDTALEQGWPAIAIPEAFGGLGLGLLEVGLVAQAAGAATTGAPFLVSSYGAVLALLAGAAEEARERWLPLLASGEAIGTVAFAEGNEALPLRPTAVFSHGTVSGVKEGVVAGLRADIAIVLARSADEPVLLLVELAKASRKAVESYDNARLYADIGLSGTPAMVLAKGADAHERALCVLAGMAVAAAHEQVGGAEALLHIARDYAVTRKAFGQPIGAFQSVKHRIAELYGLIEIARANTIHAASREGEADFIVAAADARLSATEAYDTAARDTIQIHGGVGVTWESGLHLHMRRARSLAVEHGNMLFWEDLLVEELTGVPA